MKKAAVLLTALLLASPICLFAANHYVRAGATGNGSGSDWSNACKDFSGSCASSSLVRGDTYFLAAGTYGALQLKTPDSGSLVITIQRATTSAHGTDTGWQGAFDGQVTWTNIGYQYLWSDYWVFDGVTGSGSDSASYGFYFPPANPCNKDQYALFAAGSNITVRHVAAMACSDDVEKQAIVFNGVAGTSYPDPGVTVSNEYLGYSYFSGWQNSVVLSGVTTATLEYLYSTNGFSSSSHHGEAIDAFSTKNITFRYNTLDRCAGTACIAANVGNDVAINNWSIYGNTFSNANVGNGIVGGTTQVVANTLFYNNTLFNNTTLGAWFWQADVGSPNASQATGNILQNNIVTNGACGVPQNGGGAVSHDYNAYLTCSDAVPNEGHVQTLAANPFTNPSNLDFHLINDTNVWSSLNAPFNVDPDTTQRTTSRGAFQYMTQSGLNPPTDLTATVQ